MSADRTRLVAVRIDDSLAAWRGPDAAHEINVAIYDLVDDNRFAPVGDSGGPYSLVLALEETRLALLIDGADGGRLGKVVLSLPSLRRVIRDYALVCGTYYEAIRTRSPTQIEAIDVGRRALHNEGAELLQERLAGRIEMDLTTARRLFTLVCALVAKL